MRGGGGNPEDAFPRWLGPALLSAAFALLAGWTWGKWTDIQLDFGAELYIPWRIVCGQSLYQDIAYRHGPLSPYLNALWFGIFGVSLRTLVLCNLAVLAGVCAMSYRVFRLSCGRLTATAASLTFLCVFGFSQYTRGANYNFVTPYQHGQTHGVALSIASILFFREAVRGREARWVALAGACLGLVFLTKAELLAAAAAVAVFGLFVILLARCGDGRRRAVVGGAFLGGALVPAALFFGGLSSRMPLSLAWRGMLGNWAYVGQAASDPFYVWGAGFDDIAGNLGTALLMFALVLAFAAGALVADLRLTPLRRRAAVSAAIGAAVFVLLWLGAGRLPWMRLPRALIFTTLAAAAGLVVACVRLRASREDLARWMPLSLWAVWALALLGKMALFTRIEHYGFALGMPAALLLVACLVHLLPALARARGSGGTLALSLALAGVGAGVVFHVGWTASIYALKGFAIEAGGDSLVVERPEIDPRQATIWMAAAKLRDEMAPADTLLALPEGISLNYWLRKRDPSRYSLFLPPEFAALGGEEPMLADIRAHPPDFVALIDRDSEEFRVGPFGKDPRNGRRIVEWIDSNYTRILRAGPEPFEGAGSGVVVLERKDRVRR